MRFLASEVAAATGGRLDGPDVAVEGAAIDSRTVAGGELFVAVAGERDGHDFVGAALAAGAAAALVARPAEGPGTAVVVDDTVAALAALGRAARSRVAAHVVGITGSAGKTSTKDLLAGALGRTHRTAASPKSFNNELGVPLTLVNAPADAEAVVVEMGARGRGHIAFLCELARPTVGVVTAVAAAHIEGFGSIDAVAAEKGALVEALPPEGTAVLNADDERVAAMAARTRATVVTYGRAGDVRAEGVVLDGELRPSFVLVTPHGRADVRLPARGEHQVGNALAAAAAATACGAPLDEVAAGLAEAVLSPWRMEVARTPEGALVVNDAYNANPASTEAALRSLARVDAGRRVAILGPMAELGAVSEAEHRRIGDLARSLGIEVIAVGAPGLGGTPVADGPAALAALGPLGPRDAVLVKGSRVAGLEQVALALVDGVAAW